ncbi:hypothetical protein ACSBR1_018737 [Camellia fascicularis]
MGNEQLQWEVVLIVNVASKCGLTQSNYKELNILYEKYKDQVPLFCQSWILMIMSLARWNQIIDAWIDELDDCFIKMYFDDIFV